LFIANPYPEWTLSIIDFLASYTFIGDNLSTFFMMLNRFIAIAWAFNYEKVRRFK